MMGKVEVPRKIEEGEAEEYGSISSNTRSYVFPESTWVCRIIAYPENIRKLFNSEFPSKASDFSDIKWAVRNLSDLR